MQTLETALVQANEVASKWELEKVAAVEQLSSMEAQIQQLRDSVQAPQPANLEPLPSLLPSDAPALVELLKGEVTPLQLADPSRFQALLEHVGARLSSHNRTRTRQKSSKLC